jgi:hypothetical protein
MDVQSQHPKLGSRLPGVLWAFATALVALVVLLSIRYLLIPGRIPKSAALLYLAIAALLTFIILWKLPQWQVAHLSDLTAKERFELEDKSRTTLAQIAGGLILLGGFWMTLQNFEVTRETEVTDRFTKAIEQLGEKGEQKISVRLGAIYALERIAQEDRNEHWHIMRTLTAYVRENAESKRRCHEVTSPRPCPDIEAALDVIGHRRRAYDPTDDLRLDLSSADLEGAYLSRLDLGDIVFWQTNLKNAHLQKADLESGFFAGVDLSGADLREAHLEWAHIQDAPPYKGNLKDAQLAGAHLEGTCLDSLDLTQTKGLTQEQVDKAMGNSSTQLPKDLNMPTGWSKSKSCAIN